MSEALWQVYALMWAGPMSGPGAVVMWNQDWDQEAQRGYFLWCLKGPAGTVVVDAGVGPEGRQGRDLPGYVGPEAMLERLGVKAGEVEHLVLTHLHWDHASGVGLFPKATVYVQKREHDFWTTSPAAELPLFQMMAGDLVLDGLAKARDEGRLEIMDGDADLLPGLDVLLAPGHTPGLMAVRAQTSQGTCIVGSDAGHMFRSYANTWPSIFYFDLPAYLMSMERLKGLAETRLLLPGHDLAMLSDYTPVAQGVTRIA